MYQPQSLLCRKEQHWCCYCTLGPNHFGRTFSFRFLKNLSAYYDHTYCLILKTRSSIVCLLLSKCVLCGLKQCRRTTLIFRALSFALRYISWIHKFGIQSSPLWLVESMVLFNDLERYFYYSLFSTYESCKKDLFSYFLMVQTI